MLKKKIILNHILFLFITLFLGNLISILLFNDLTTFYHDNLDSLVVYNKILGDFYSGNKISSEIFLNGELKIFYLRHFLKPFIFIYSIFDIKFAYFFSEFFSSFSTKFILPSIKLVFSFKDLLLKYELRIPIFSITTSANSFAN